MLMMVIVLNGPKLRAMREANGWLQDDLARRAGLDQALISRLERGKAGDVKHAWVRGLARAFGMSVDELSRELIVEVNDQAS